MRRCDAFFEFSFLNFYPDWILYAVSSSPLLSLRHTVENAHCRPLLRHSGDTRKMTAMTTTVLVISRSGGLDAGGSRRGGSLGAAATPRGGLVNGGGAKMAKGGLRFGMEMRKGAAARGAFTALAAADQNRPVVIIDNYDSFTYNLSQVRPCRESTRTHHILTPQNNVGCVFFFLRPPPLATPHLKRKLDSHPLSTTCTPRNSTWATAGASTWCTRTTRRRQGRTHLPRGVTDWLHGPSWRGVINWCFRPLGLAALPGVKTGNVGHIGCHQLVS